MAAKFKPLDWVENDPIHIHTYDLPPSYQARVYIGIEMLIYDIVRLAEDDYRYSVFFKQTRIIDNNFTTDRLDDFSFGDLDDAKKHAEYHYQSQMNMILIAIERYKEKEMSFSES